MFQCSTDGETCREGVKTKSGKVLIPLSSGYENVCYHSEDGHGGYFCAEKGNKTAIYDRYGKYLFTSYTDVICHDDGYFYEDKNGKYKQTVFSLDENGHGIQHGSRPSATYPSQSAYTPQFPPYNPNVDYSQPVYGNQGYGNSGYDNNNNNNSSVDYEQRKRDTMNTTVGTVCPVCHGDKKCISCHGTGYRTDNAFGTGVDTSHVCGVCNGQKICTSCGGTGKSRWNR